MDKEIDFITPFLSDARLLGFVLRFDHFIQRPIIIEIFLCDDLIFIVALLQHNLKILGSKTQIPSAGYPADGWLFSQKDTGQ